MKQKVLLAIMVYAIDRDMLKLPVELVIEAFKQDAVKCYDTFTDPDTDLYCENLLAKDPAEVMAEYVLSYARSWMLSGIRSYGKYDKYLTA